MILITNPELSSFCFIFVANSGLIWMFTLLCFFGTIITTWVMKRTGALVCERDERVESKSTDRIHSETEKPLRGDAVQVISFTLKSPKAFTKWMQRMPERSLLLLLKWLRFDFWFMFFLFPFLSLLTALLTRFTCLSQQTPWTDISAFLIALPLITGLTDVLENLFAISLIKRKENLHTPNRIENVNALYVRLMQLFSILKWFGVLASIIALAMIISNAMKFC